MTNDQQAHLVLCDLPEHDYQTMLCRFRIPPEVASGKLGDREAEVTRILQFMKSTQRRLTHA